jgi:hypothetical protein
MLFNVGDFVLTCVLEPGDINDDPVATAQISPPVARLSVESRKPTTGFPCDLLCNQLWLQTSFQLRL